jgi:hypothetical protein
VSPGYYQEGATRDWCLHLTTQTINYSGVLTGRKGKLRKLMVKSKHPLPPESIKQIQKTCMNPTELKVAINNIKSFKDGRVLIESSSNREIEILNTHIRSKCGEQLEVRI